MIQHREGASKVAHVITSESSLCALLGPGAVQGTHTGYVSIVSNAYTRYPGRVASSVRLDRAGICMERRCAASKTPFFVKKTAFT